MIKKIIFLLVGIGGMTTLNAQTFNGSGGTIPDNSPAVYFPITVSGLPVSSLDSSFGVESVCINITHSNDYQLTIQLLAPDGTLIDLSMNNGGTGNNYFNTCFSGLATTSITAVSPPFSGTYQPEGILGNVNNGQNGNNTWQLKVQDHNSPSTGTLSSWSITFSNTPSLPFIYSSSNLPIVVINTFGQTIPDDPKIVAHMGIIDNGFGNRNYLTDSFNSYNGNIGIELRGSWSQTFPQKQYGFETLDSLNVEIDTTVMGMPAESDWILHAPYNDKTCMRNVLVYDIANKTGHYASRTRFCELVVNNEYSGIYVMMEKIKRDANRVDISKLLPTDTAGADLTGGYIIKIDKVTGSGGAGWNSFYAGVPGTPIQFQYEYPDDDEIVPQQMTYIRSYVDSFERALAAPWFLNADSGYKKFIDLPSFVDYFILNETCKNVDAYRISTFLYKQKITKGGKMLIGPAWDYNIGFRNADYCEGELTTGWQYQFNAICGAPGFNNVPFWWGKMMQDTAFTNTLKCRWNYLRSTTLHVDTLWNQVDSIAAVLDEAKNRHFIKWPILGVQTWANPAPIPADYAGEISSMKSWMLSRLLWLDANMPGNCVVTNLEQPDVAVRGVYIYPNPISDKLNVRLTLQKPGKVLMKISDVSGRIVLLLEKEFLTTGENNIELNTMQVNPGVYFLSLLSDDGLKTIKLVKE